MLVFSLYTGSDTTNSPGVTVTTVLHQHQVILKLLIRAILVLHETLPVKQLTGET